MQFHLSMTDAALYSLSGASEVAAGVLPVQSVMKQCSACTLT